MGKQPGGKLARREAIEGYMFIAPWLIGFFAFTFGPMLFSIYISMCDWDIINPPRFVGLDNFKQAIFDDFRFAQAIKVTFTYIIFALPLGLVGSLLVAILLNQKVKGMTWFRTIFYIPAVLPGIAVAIVWKWIFNPEYGILNIALVKMFPPLAKYVTPFLWYLWPIVLVLGIALFVKWANAAGSRRLRRFLYVPALIGGVIIGYTWHWTFTWATETMKRLAIDPPPWLASTEWALPAFILMSLWGIGGGMIIYLAGLQGIPTQLYEAAEIDGANPVQKFFKITLPMISPTIFFNMVMGVIGSFQVFTSSFVMTQGGPAYATLFYLLYLYQKAFQYFQMGYAAAMAWILFIIILCCTLIVFKSSAKWVYYESDLRRR